MRMMSKKELSSEENGYCKEVQKTHSSVDC